MHRAGPRRRGVLRSDRRLDPPGRPHLPEAAAVELARRYLQGYGPAAPTDLARWSGLPPAVARRAWGAIAGELAEVTSGEEPSWVWKRRARGVGKAAREPAGVRLLGAFDPLLLGYSHRDLFVAPPHARNVNAGGGVIKFTVLVDARVAGTWKLVGRAGSRRTQVDLFDDVGPQIAEGIEEEVRDVERFSG